MIREMDKSIYWLRFQTSLLKIDRSTVKKSCKTIGDLNNTIKQMDLIENTRPFHPTTTNNTFFSRMRDTVTEIENIMGHKASFNQKDQNNGIYYLTTIQEEITHTHTQMC